MIIKLNKADYTKCRDIYSWTFSKNIDPNLIFEIDNKQYILYQIEENNQIKYYKLIENIL